MLPKFVLFIILGIFIVSEVKASCVILLHGLVRTSFSMRSIENALQKENYRVINIGYPSRKNSIEELAVSTIKSALQQCQNNQEINFVTHSLGGILVRQYLSEHDISNLNRVVMLAPPNKGSEVVDKLKNVPGFHFINGEAGLQLSANPNSLPNQLPDADFDVGIIAGNSSLNFIFASMISGENDGTVSVENTKLAGMKDHLVLPTNHTFIMYNKDVIKQVVYYLKHGQFKRD